MIEEITYVACRVVSVTALYTSTFVTLNAGAGTPFGLSIPTRASTTGLTILYYSESDGQSNPANGYKIYVDSSAGAGGYVDQNSASGSFSPADYFVNGLAWSSGPYTMYERNPNKFVLVGLRTGTSSASFGAGAICLNMFAGATTPVYSLPNFKLARILIYYRRFSNAEFGQLLPPADYEQEYDFSGYQPGDLTGTDLVSGRDASLAY